MKQMLKSHTYRFRCRQVLATDIAEAWTFFSSPLNLATITPPSLNFKILETNHPNELVEGLLINYRLRPLLGIPLHWQTEIAKVEKPHSFTDRQLKGPYARWEHTHTFNEHPKGVLMTDEVVYQLPYGFIGNLAHRLLVKKRIEQIFEYRRLKLHQIFNSDEYCVN